MDFEIRTDRRPQGVHYREHGRSVHVVVTAPGVAVTTPEQAALRRRR